MMMMPKILPRERESHPQLFCCWLTKSGWGVGECVRVKNFEESSVQEIILINNKRHPELSDKPFWCLPTLVDTHKGLWDEEKDPFRKVAQAL